MISTEQNERLTQTGPGTPMGELLRRYWWPIAATIDLDHDSESREAGEKIRCSLLVLWGAKGKIGEWYEPLDIWRRYCEAEVVGGPVNSGHYLAEEAPDEVLERFFAFFE